MGLSSLFFKLFSLLRGKLNERLLEHLPDQVLGPHLYLQIPSGSPRLYVLTRPALKYYPLNISNPQRAQADAHTQITPSTGLITHATRPPPPSAANRTRLAGRGAGVAAAAVHVCALKYNHLQKGPIYSELAECAEMQHASYVNKACGHARALIVIHTRTYQEEARCFTATVTHFRECLVVTN